MEKLLAGTIMVTTDVVGLYPHIPHDAGLEAIKEAPNRREDQEILVCPQFFVSCELFFFEHASEHGARERP